MAEPLGPLPAEGLAEGFAAAVEPTPLIVSKENIAPFSLPAEALTYSPAPEVVIHSFKSGDRERKIYCNIELNETEREQLKRLQEETRSRGTCFMPSVAVMATRFLSRARGDTQRAAKLMQTTNGWRHDFFKERPVCDEDVLEDLKHGIVYFCGRDRDLRPTIVVRGNRIPTQWYKERRTDRLIRVLIFCMEYMIRYMLVPGKVENNCLIVDLKGLTLAQVPLKALTEVYNVMSHHYIGRVFKFYICNLSRTLSAIAGMAKSILTDRQKQKLVFVDSLEELRREFALHHLEEDLGGTRPVLRQFFPFPLQAGPFEGGWSQGPEEGAVPNGHEVFTERGSRGRLWDERLNREENLLAEFSGEAPEFFRRCGLPLPPMCLRVARQRGEPEEGPQEASPRRGWGPRAEEPAAAAAAGPAGAQAPQGPPRSGEGPRQPPLSERSEGERRDKALQAASRPVDEAASTAESGGPPPEQVEVQESGVKPKGIFSCAPCFCNHR